MGLETVTQQSNGAAALAEEPFVGTKVPASQRKGLAETPVDAYQNQNKIPREFVIDDPKTIPGRNWGDNDASGLSETPVVDMADLMTLGEDGKPLNPEGARRVIDEIGKASEEWGFFQVVNHGISEEVLKKVLDVQKEFFQLPLEEKEKYAARAGELDGYGRFDFMLAGDGPGGTRFWNDALRYTIKPKRDTADDHMPPDNPPAYRPIMEEYTVGMERVYDKVWQALSIYLGLEPYTLRDAQGPKDDELLILRVNYYPKCLEPEKVLGLAAHKDFGCVTILLQDEVGGLQVQKRGDTDGLWRDVRPEKGALLINLANQVEILTNGQYHSVLHRAMVNKTSARLSVVGFATPGLKCVIAPIPELLEITKKLPLYTSLVYGDYMENFAVDSKAGRPPHAR